MKNLTTAELKAERDRVLHEIEMEKLYANPSIVGSEEFNVAMVRRYGGILLHLNKAIEARKRNMRITIDGNTRIVDFYEEGEEA